MFAFLTNNVICLHHNSFTNTLSFRRCKSTNCYRNEQENNAKTPLFQSCALIITHKKTCRQHIIHVSLRPHFLPSSHHIVDGDAQ